MDKTPKKKENANLHAGHRERVREKYINSGNLDDFKEHEALEFLLYYCYPQQDTNEIAHKMIREFGSASKLFEAPPREIAKRCNVTERVAILVSLVPHLSKIYLTGRYQEKECMTNSKLVGEYCVSLFTNTQYECFYIVCLDTQRRLIRAELVHKGGLNSSAIYPRVVLEAAIKNRAACVVLTHNHPGGSLLPSKSDMEVTKKLKTALSSVDIELIDHVIVAGDKYYSFIEKKLHF